jgi:hypothetical protein
LSGSEWKRNGGRNLPLTFVCSVLSYYFCFSDFWCVDVDVVFWFRFWCWMSCGFMEGFGGYCWLERFVDDESWFERGFWFWFGDVSVVLI